MNTLQNYIFSAFALVGLCLIMAFTFDDDNVGQQETILDVKNVAIDFFNPAKFYFYREREEGYFKAGDAITFNIKVMEISAKNARKLLGGGKYEHLKIIMINLNTGAEEIIYAADFGKPYKFGGNNAPGNYSMEITGTKKLTPLHITVVRTLGEPMSDEDLAATYDMVHVETMYIGLFPDSQPKFNLNLNEKDQIGISSTSALNIKFKLFQTGKVYPLPMGGPIVMPEAGIKTLEFVVEIEKTKNGLFNFKKSDKRYIDLIIKRVPYIEPPENASGAAGGGTGEGDGTADGTDPNDPFGGEDPLEALKNAAEDKTGALIAKHMENMAEFMKSMAEKKIVTKPKYINGKNEEAVVSSKLDLNGSKRLCLKLDLQAANYWTYWVGVSQKAEENYAAEQKDIIARSREGVQSLLEHYALSIIDNVNTKSNYPSFSVIDTKLSNSGEFVEYAIVNEINKQKFKKGEKYSSYRPGWRSQNAVTDYGNSAFPDDNLYACFCNHNKMSPVDVFFKYELYEKEKLEL